MNIQIKVSFILNAMNNTEDRQSTQEDHVDLASISRAIFSMYRKERYNINLKLSLAQQKIKNYYHQLCGSLNNNITINVYKGYELLVDNQELKEDININNLQEFNHIIEFLQTLQKKINKIPILPECNIFADILKEKINNFINTEIKIEDIVNTKLIDIINIDIFFLDINELNKILHDSQTLLYKSYNELRIAFKNYVEKITYSHVKKQYAQILNHNFLFKEDRLKELPTPQNGTFHIGLLSNHMEQYILNINQLSQLNDLAQQLGINLLEIHLLDIKGASCDICITATCYLLVGIVLGFGIIFIITQAMR